MAPSTNQNGETLALVEEILEIFSEKYAGREKLKTLIKNVEYANSLFGKLWNVIDQYDKQGKNIDQQVHFGKLLRDFKQLIEENIKKSTQRHDIVLSLEDYLSAIREDYRIIRNYVQTLEDINAKIEKKVRLLKDKNRIGQLIIRGVEEKIPNLIYFDPTESHPEKKKSHIVKQFYGHFVIYISYIRESSENIFDDDKYALRLEDIQSKLLSREPIDIKDYFSKMKDKLSNDRGYSTEILLRSLAKNPMVLISVSNDSKFYFTELIQTFSKLAHSKTTASDKKCIEPLTTLIFHLDRVNFGNLNEAIFANNEIIDLVFKKVYDKGIELYSNASEHISTTSVNQNDYFRSTSSENAIKLKGRFLDFFDLILSKNSNLLDTLRDSVIEEKNSNGTFRLLSDIYGQRIQSLNLNVSDDIINVKYCFNYHFFKSLKYQDLDDVPRPQLFARLLFYIHAHDNKQNSSEIEEKHKNDLFNLKTEFIEVYKEDNDIKLNSLIEILKIMINIQTYNFRLKISTSILSKLKKESDNEQLNARIETLKEFFDNTINEKEVCLRLAQSFNIHLLKDVFEDRDLILTKLCNYNSNFKLFMDKKKEFNKTFDIDRDLIAGFSIPYYLSVKLTEDDRYNSKSNNYNEKNYQIVMSILFKVFNCSSDQDKKQFLKSKNELNKEFVKLFESVNQLIKFYNQDDNENIRQELQKISIVHILDGFSRKNEESLNNRNEYARIIIDNFINYKIEHVIKVVESTKSTDEVFNTFNKVMKGKDYYSLSEWAQNTSQLGDKLYFLYCYHQYSKDQFDEWFKELNRDISKTTYDMIKTKRKLVEDELQENNEAFKQLNIKYLQHNQVGALALIYDHLEDPLKNKDNLFIKIGTGQGKSLTIAETARKVIQMNRNSATGARQQVFVITCYDHLAKRDFENYQSYYKHFDIQSMYCSSDSSTKDLSDRDVIYADLDTYFDVLRKDGFNTLTKSGRIDLADISDAVLIMDEFDSLILDSDQIFQRVNYFELDNYYKTMRLDRKEDIKNLFDRAVTKQLEKKFSSVFDRWCEELLREKQEEDKKNDTKKFQDSLGKDIRFVGSFLNVLTNDAKANFVSFYLDPLVFYSKFKQVIGFSGSITANGMNKFKTLFENKKCLYYEIPPFFGLLNLRKNRTFQNDPGIVRENTDDYLKAIREEIKKRHLEQPILIFADSVKKPDQEKSDYEYIHEKLIETKETLLKNSTIIKIENEADINKNIHKIGKLGSVTLATRIIGRGADIKVDKNIKKGLHLLLTYYPERENIYIQMLGRTARQDEKGSYSEITRSVKKFSDVADVKVNSIKKIWHNVTEHFYKNVSSNSTNKNLAIKWALFSSLMQLIPGNEIDQNDLINFVDTNILNL